MKRVALIALLLLGWTAGAVYEDKIFEDYNEQDGLSLHSRGLLTYGGQTNTFHARHLFLRSNYQRGPIQFFATLNGYADTHDPSINYGYILNNINVYDYGFIFRFFGGFFVSPRAAATYREDLETYLMMPAYIFGSPAEFDPVTGYIQVGKIGPGIRVGYKGDTFELGYSQGDFRHCIPSGFLAKVNFENGYLRAAYLSNYQVPDAFVRSSLEHKIVLNGVGKWRIFQDVNFGGLVETHYTDTGTLRVRFEQALEYEQVVLAFRQMFMSHTVGVYEIGLKRNIENVASLGIQWASNGSLYLGGSVLF